ncbi:hypothetical protein TARUN_3719 [Trichoderma arundinaceum]|uniref:Nephrocystin 3-like N-terminal domain-containing protein n=1 Tax=Trichoderma arundinaceum TaxID=490622 RepID=A0A395NQX9_TRIAR|nr:hypothetical protein TARUN_3719 [Trichoderma arundinaceum]
MVSKWSGEREDAIDDEDIDAVFIGRDDVSDYNPGQILPLPPDIIEAIRAWLQPTAYDIAGGEYRKHISSHVAGTGTWLTSSDMYQEWLKSEKHGLLWIKGIPGSGKSVVAANLINELTKSNPGSPVLFFFFRQIIDANHEPHALLRDWMDQILSYSPPLQKQLKTHVEAGRSLESISMEEMWRHLRLAFAGLPKKVFCVADALDEMDQGNEEFLSALGELGQWRPETVKVLITSRPVSKVEVPMRKIPCLHLRLQENLVDTDISTYVNFALSKSDIPMSYWQIIANAVPGRANGLFLYAKLAMDAFLEPGVDINTVLSQLPQDLNALYTDLLNEHAKRSGVPESIQRLILLSVTHATRPLRLIELAEMIRVSRPDGCTRDIRATKDLIRAACGPLLEVLPDETVSVIHHSFTEYLKGTTRSEENLDTGYPILQMGPTHTQLALQCLIYLQAGCLSSVKIGSSDDAENTYWKEWGLVNTHEPSSGKVLEDEVQLRLKYPFFEYAVSNWHQHIVKSETAGQDQTEINEKLHQLFGDSKNMAAWLQMRWPGRSVGAKLVTQLHIAAKTGLVSYTKELLKTFDANVRDYYDRTPVWWAAVEGHAKVICALVEAGANPDHPDNITGVKPLHRAAASNHYAAVTQLLKAGVDPLTPKTLNEDWLTCCGRELMTSIGDTAVMYACCGHVETIEAFLPFIGDDIDLVHRALAWAAKARSPRVVERILQHPGVDVNAVVRGQTALYRACVRLDLPTATILLKAGADPNIKCDIHGDRVFRLAHDEENPTMLTCFFALCDHAGSASDYDATLEALFSLLVEAGVDIHDRTPSGETALHTAAKSPALVRLLLDAGLDANATDSSGATPLHRLNLTIESSAPSIALLIKQGNANINAAQVDGQTPLHFMVTSYEQTMLLAFLEYEPNVNAVDNRGNSALHILMEAKRPNIDTIKALLERGADPNVKNHNGLTPLLLLDHSDFTYTEIVNAFIEAGADINMTDRDGNTLLFRLLSTSTMRRGKNSHTDLTYLIDRGFSLSQRNFHGHTALHQAVTCYSAGRPYGRLLGLEMTRFDFLLGLNLDVMAVDYNGNNLLHTLAMRTDNHDSYSGVRLVTLWEQLLDLGLDLEQKNHAGRTPLHILCTYPTHSLRFVQGDKMPVDFVISKSKNLNVTDLDGITPLHIAVACGGLYVKNLLDAGANPLVYTHEGLTPLHLAARCRDSNAVGLLLGTMRKQQGEISSIVAGVTQCNEDNKMLSNSAIVKSQRVVGVDAKALDNDKAITPLYYACRSGRPETVALLLEAGADVHIGNIFEACLDFEEECSLWNQQRPPKYGREHTYAPPLKLADEYRDVGYYASISGVPGISLKDTARLEEIIDMLVTSGVDISQLDGSDAEQQDGIINAAVAQNRDYTAACLRRGRSQNSTVSETKLGRGELTRLSEAMIHHQKEASIQALLSSDIVDSGNGDQAVSLGVLTRFLIRREYHLVEELARLGTNFLLISAKDEYCRLSHLVRLGFASLVDKIGSIEANSRLQKGDWHAFGDNTRPGLWHAKRDSSHYHTPLILDAVRRHLPNMDIVRLLVEKFAIDINEANKSGESALFHVARGQRWWHVNQALPYLLDAGADIHMRNNEGQTPLHMALQANDQWSGPYNWDAAKILIERGADVNAIDGNGQSCLASAKYNAGMVKLLIKYGATTTADSIFAAIDSGDANVLKALLSGGMDPNTRRDKPPNFSVEMMNKDDVEPQEEFPIYYATMKLKQSWKPLDKDYKGMAQAIEIIQVLLDHGADPFAKFLKKDLQAEDKPGTFIAKNSIKVPQGYKECTLLHELFRVGKLVDPFLKLPDLDANNRDAKGRTLLHMACENWSGPNHIIGSYVKNWKILLKERVHTFQRLLSLGAQLKARDYFGRNVIHYMLGGEVELGYRSYDKFLAYTIETAPELLNQGDENGETPLHYAMRLSLRRKDADEAEILLSAGADHMMLNKNGDTMLHLLGRGLAVAALRSLFQNLIERGIDINARNSLGETALFPFYSLPKTVPTPWVLIEEKNLTPDQAKPMLEKLGGDFFVRDNKGRGLLHAAAGGDVERFQELMDMGLDPMMEDNSQQTAIDAAAACGNRDILELFEKKD